MTAIPVSDAAEGKAPEQAVSRGRARGPLGGLLRAVPFLLAGGLTFLAFFPGHANGDTGGIYLEATGHLPVDNWHPTMNIVIIYSLLQLWDSPAVVLAFQCLLLWGGLAMSAIAIGRRSSFPAALFFIPIGFLPVVFNYMGVLIKDSLSAGFTLVAIGLLLFERDATKGRRTFLLVAVVFLWFAYMVKYPALPIVMALFTYAAARWFHGRSRSFVLAATGVVAAVALIGCVLSPRLLDRVVSARDTHPEQAIQLFDLAGITHFSGTNAFGEALVPSERVADFVDGDCYDPELWDTLAWFGVCSFVTDNAEPLIGTDVVSSRWRDGIIDRPVDYARHRLSHLAAFSLRPGKYQLYYDFVDSRLDWAPEHNSLMDAYRVVISHTEGWPQRRHVFWQVASVVLLGVLLRRRWRRTSGPFDAVLTAAMVGNVLFYLGWLVIGVSSEFRYSYTVIITCLVTTATLLVEAVAPSAPRRSRSSR